MTAQTTDGRWVDTGGLLPEWVEFDPEPCVRHACPNAADETLPEPYGRYCSEGCHDDDAYDAEARRIAAALYDMAGDPRFTRPPPRPVGRLRALARRVRRWLAQTGGGRRG